jgi:hypothetical protein
MGRFGNWKDPAVLVLVVNGVLVAFCTAVTTAPWTTAELGSCTTPLKDPVVIP